ncbi:MAG: glycosyltransferase family 2 protein [Cyanobacteriota bacterium]|jgi:hypothetical protein
MAAKENINYKMFNLFYAAKGKVLRSAPDLLVPKRVNLNSSLQIAITTYIDRYDKFFKPLYITLKRLFPEVQINIAVNGFHEREVQTQYLSRIQSELCTDKINQNRFILHDNPVGLTRLWNELLSQGDCKTTLILNDDLKVYPWFRCWIEKKLWHSNITLINGTWSHFFFSKDILPIVGWFDEDFRGIGFEDMDYTARCACEGITINNIRCQYITHLDHQPSRTSFDDQSSTLWGPKYSTINHDSFFRKWKLCGHDSGIYIKQLKSFVMPNYITEPKLNEIKLTFKNGICYPDRD